MRLQENSYDIDYSKHLGKGSYGIVYACSHLQIKEELCVKIVKTDLIDKKLINRESEILIKLKDVNNPNLVKIYDVYFVPEENELHIVMELCTGDLQKSINDKIKNGEKYSATQIFDILTQIINGYKTLLELKIIHRDLKPANILINKFGKIKITDFGIGRITEDMNQKYPMTKVGTPAYASPQLYLEPNYSSKCDIYSLGVILHQLEFLKLPYKGSNQQDAIKFVTSLKYLPFKCEEINTEQTSQDNNKIIRQLIDKMLTYTEGQRISWEELQQVNYAQQNKQKNSIADSIEQESVSIIQDTIELYNERYLNQNNLEKKNEINNFIKLLQAKGRLANQLLQALIDLRTNNQKFLSRPHYNMIITCMAGYYYQISQNAFGFANNQTQLICKEVFEIVDFKQFISQYCQDQSEQYKKVINQTHFDIQQSKSIFQQMQNEMQNEIIHFLKDQTYFNNFIQQINVNNTNFNIYQRWFKFFYQKFIKIELKFNNLHFYSLEILTFILLTEKFLRVEIDYPFQKYSKLDPTNIYLSETQDKQFLIAIILSYHEQ